MQTHSVRKTMVQWAMRAAALAAISVAWGCASEPTDVGGAECTVDGQCGAGQACRSGRCINVPCGDGGPCPVGQSCLGGRCVDPQERCRTDDDCPGGRCVDGECFQNECQDGEERACENACGTGTERCAGGVWRGCSARAQSELCDGQDNDCDGQSDELLDCTGCAEGETRPCQNECGSGNEQCLGGSWRGCDAPRPRIEICGDGIDADCDGTVDEGCDGCADGEERACENECGAGTETCVDATFTGCDAPTPTDEFCDGADNDCDGQIDEQLTRGCNNACGAGTETCAEGAWSGCTAPENCACGEGVAADVQVCGACGYRQRECAGGMWGAWSACDEGEVQCRPGEQELGPCGNCGTRRRQCTAECRWGDWAACASEQVCAPGAEEIRACENGCGDQSRICSDACTWDEWGACDGGGGGLSCNPGEMQQEACGNCGTRTRRCGEGCIYGEWGACESEGLCAPGDEENRACDGETAQSRTCDDQCRWGEYGACSGDQCQPGEEQEQACGNCGTRTRACTPARIWGDWSACGDQGACAPGDVDEDTCGSDVGECRPGVTTRTCNGQCAWSDFGPCRDEVGPAAEICGNRGDEDCDGRVIRRPDVWEDNDDCGSCYLIEDGAEDPNVFLRATIDYFGDVDYYCFTGVDNLGFGNEEIIVTLEDIPDGNDYDIYLYRNTDDCRARNELASSLEFGNTDESLTWGEQFNFDDDSTYIVEVRSLGDDHHCDREYRLTINGLR